MMKSATGVSGGDMGPQQDYGSYDMSSSTNINTNNLDTGGSITTFKHEFNPTTTAATATTAAAAAAATTNISNTASSAQSIYESGGDVSSALEILTQNSMTQTEIENENETMEPESFETAKQIQTATSVLDKNHNVALLSYLSTLQANKNSNNGNNVVMNLNSKDSNELFQIQLEEMYSKELEKDKLQSCGNNNNNNNNNNTSSSNYTSSICSSSQPSETYDQTILRRMILGHNLGLNYLITNKPDRGVDILLPLFQSFLMKDEDGNVSSSLITTSTHDTKKDTDTTITSIPRKGKDEIENSYDNPNFKFGNVKCKIAFLLLDCILATNQVNALNPVLLQWIEKFIIWSIHTKKEDEPTISALKFRLHCYKSKCLFLQNKYEDMKVREANTRVAKKELKSAMEIYHHKLAKNVWTQSSKNGGGNDGIASGNGGGEGEGEGGESTLVDEGASIQESIALSIGSMSHDLLQDSSSIHHYHSQNAGTVASSTQNNHMNGTTTSSTGGGGGAVRTVTEFRTQFQTKQLHRQNQSALYLKANLEHLKGNTKKSLKLCAEAQICGIRQRDSSVVSNTTTSDQQSLNGGIDRSESQCSSDEQYAHHYNNLAIINQVAGKLHLAMHYYSISLGHIERIEDNMDSMIVEEDGIASPLPLSQILFNAAICAQQLSNFTTAHECMKRCVAFSPSTFGKDPFCWYHMGESCINNHVTLKRKNRKNSSASR